MAELRVGVRLQPQQGRLWEPLEMAPFYAPAPPPLLHLHPPRPRASPSPPARGRASPSPPAKGRASHSPPARGGPSPLTRGSPSPPTRPRGSYSPSPVSRAAHRRGSFRISEEGIVTAAPGHRQAAPPPLHNDNNNMPERSGLSTSSQRTPCSADAGGRTKLAFPVQQHDQGCADPSTASPSRPQRWQQQHQQQHQRQHSQQRRSFEARTATDSAQQGPRLVGPQGSLPSDHDIPSQASAYPPSSFLHEDWSEEKAEEASENDLPESTARPSSFPGGALPAWQRRETTPPVAQELSAVRERVERDYSPSPVTAGSAPASPGGHVAGPRPRAQPRSGLSLQGSPIHQKDLFLGLAGGGGGSAPASPSCARRVLPRKGTRLAASLPAPPPPSQVLVPRSSYVPAPPSPSKVLLPRPSCMPHRKSASDLQGAAAWAMDKARPALLAQQGGPRSSLLLPGRFSAPGTPVAPCPARQTEWRQDASPSLSHGHQGQMEQPEIMVPARMAREHAWSPVGGTSLDRSSPDTHSPAMSRRSAPSHPQDIGAFRANAPSPAAARLPAVRGTARLSPGSRAPVAAAARSGSLSPRQPRCCRQPVQWEQQPDYRAVGSPRNRPAGANLPGDRLSPSASSRAWPQAPVQSPFLCEGVRRLPSKPAAAPASVLPRSVSAGHFGNNALQQCCAALEQKWCDESAADKKVQGTPTVRVLPVRKGAVRRMKGQQGRGLERSKGSESAVCVTREDEPGQGRQQGMKQQQEHWQNEAMCRQQASMGAKLVVPQQHSAIWDEVPLKLRETAGGCALRGPSGAVMEVTKVIDVRTPRPLGKTTDSAGVLHSTKQAMSNEGHCSQELNEDQWEAQAALQSKASPVCLPPGKWRRPQDHILGIPYKDLSEYFLVQAKELGAGQFGVIRRCRDTATGKAFACKSISKGGVLCPEDAEDVRKEVACLVALRAHPGVVTVRAVFEDAQAVHIVMELLEGGDLLDRVLGRGHLGEADCARLCAAVVGALVHCHSVGILHRDVKPDNILLRSRSSDSEAALVDFGVATFFDPSELETEVIGTPEYMAPEVFLQQYGPEADIWSAGVVLYTAVSGATPFWGSSKEKLVESIFSRELQFQCGVWAQLSAECKDLVARMLRRDPKRRISGAEVLSHPWIRKHTC